MKGWMSWKDIAMFDGEEMAQIRASTVHQKSDKVYATLQCAAILHCLMKEYHDCEETERGKKS